MYIEELIEPTLSMIYAVAWRNYAPMSQYGDGSLYLLSHVDNYMTVDWYPM